MAEEPRPPEVGPRLLSGASLVVWGFTGIAIATVLSGAQPALTVAAIVASAVASFLHWRAVFHRRRVAWESRTRAEIHRQTGAALEQKYALRTQRLADAVASGEPDSRDQSNARFFLMLTDITQWGYGLVAYVVRAQRRLADQGWAPPYGLPPPIPERSDRSARIEAAIGEAVQFLAQFSDPDLRAAYYRDAGPRPKRDRWIEAAAGHAMAIWQAAEETAREYRQHAAGRGTAAAS